MTRSNEKQYFYRTLNQGKSEKMTLENLERSYFSPTSKSGLDNSGVTSPNRGTIRVEESFSPSPASPMNYQPLRASRESGEKNYD